MNSKAPKHMIEQLPDGTLTALLPASVNSLSELERMPLYRIRDHISSLMCQGYALGVRKLFDDHPNLIAIGIENSDDQSDNGRNVRFEVLDVSEDCSGDEEKKIEKAVDDTYDYLNGAVRDRIIYDFLDNFIAIGTLQRDAFDEQVGKAYDETFGETGGWMRLRADGDASQLEQQTPASGPGAARPRM